MAAGFLGLPVGSWSPMMGLGQLAQNGDASGTSSPQMAAPAAAPMPDPATTGSVPSAPAGGGGQRGIGDIVSDAMSGRGIMGAQPGDDRLDPSTGATTGQMRSANMSSMMQMGLLLMAAGARQSSDSRAAVLSRAPLLLDNTDKINEFAKTRLAMANARLAERKQAQAEEKTRYVRALLGGSGAATLGPTTAPAPPAGGIAPAAGSAIVPPAGGAMPSTPVASPETTGSAGAPRAGVTSGMSPGEVAAIAGMDDEKALETLARRRGEIDGTERMGTPYVDPQTGEKLAPVYKNGVMTRTQSIGKLLGEVSQEGGKQITRQGGVVTGITDLSEDPQDVEERKMSAGLRGERFKALEGRKTGVQGDAVSYDRLLSAEQAVREGKTVNGFGADYRERAMTLMDTMGVLSPEGRAQLVAGADVESILGRAGGEFAKAYYGPQISNADVENARKAIGGLKSNAPDVVANALKSLRESTKQRITQYNADVDGHNSRLKSIRSEDLRADITAQKVERDFPDLPKKAAPGQTTTQAPAQQYTPEQIAAARAELARRRAQGGR